MFGRGRSAAATFLALLTQLFLVQIGLKLFIGKATAQTSGRNCQCRCNFYLALRPGTICHGHLGSG